MLRNTFVHLPGIGLKTERRLWDLGILDWRDLLASGVSARLRLEPHIRLSEQALDAKDLAFFFSRLPAGERWRVFDEFPDEFVAVDIETTGLSIYDRLTVVGTASTDGYQAFIRSINLDSLVDFFHEARGVITFNGSQFDLPFLRRSLDDVRLPEAHLDLRYLGRRVGLAGPLKRVEHEAGIAREEGLRDISGFEATVLWNRFEQGEHQALELLLQYNAADTCTLRVLGLELTKRLRETLAAVSSPVSRSFLSPTLSDTLVRAEPIPSIQRPVIALSDSVLTVNGVAHRVPPAIPRGETYTIHHLLAQMSDPASRIVGIDLTGSEARPSGWALLSRDLVTTTVLRTTEEIIRTTIDVHPDLVSIDSPLSLPEGRDCTRDDCVCRTHGITRFCERELRKRGVGVYPCLIPSMRALTERGMYIAERLRAAGILVIESFPGAAQDIMGIPRKRVSMSQLRGGLEGFGVRGIRPVEQLKHDELDAITSAVVGTFYLANAYEAIGNDVEGYLIVPVAELDSTPPTYPSAKQQSLSTPLLFVVLANGRMEELAQARDAFRVRVTDCRGQAELMYRSNQAVVLVTKDQHDYVQLFQCFGPAVRSARVQEPDIPTVAAGLTPDLVVDSANPEWIPTIRSWIASFSCERVATCQ